MSIYIDQQVQALRALHGNMLSGAYLSWSIRDTLAAQAAAILDGHRHGNSAVTFHLGSWCPEFIGAAPEKIMASTLNLDQARLTIAREHGYPDWSSVEALGNEQFNSEFEKAVDAVVHGDIAKLQKLLGANPELINQRSQYGHRATLLHYIGANGVESYRQITPMNAAEVAQYLISTGAEVNAEAQMYGGSTTLGLVLSSAHPHNAGVQQAIVGVLEGAGAV